VIPPKCGATGSSVASPLESEVGTAKAITALARILWHLIKHRAPYDPTVWTKAEEKLRKRKIKRLHQTAAALGLKLLTAS
jgi:archaellum biogenesis protein FlaJ (TadC family)